jgi:hypothetical protein
MLLLSCRFHQSSHKVTERGAIGVGAVKDSSDRALVEDRDSI